MTHLPCTKMAADMATVLTDNGVVVVPVACDIQLVVDTQYMSVLSVIMSTLKIKNEDNATYYAVGSWMISAHRKTWRLAWTGLLCH